MLLLQAYFQYWFCGYILNSKNPLNQKVYVGVYYLSLTFQLSHSIQCFYYSVCFTVKRAENWTSPFLRHCAWATQFLLKNSRKGGEPLAILCPIWSARELNLKPPASENNLLPLEQLAGLKINKFYILQMSIFIFKQMKTWWK